MAKVIIGLDKGHGEISAFLYKLNSATPAEALALDRDGEKVIPSAIAYDEGTVCIGYPASKKKEVICYFKTAPDNWVNRSGSPKKYEGTLYNVRDLMADEIGMIYKAIWTYNTKVGLEEGDEVFLYVGCPSAATWMSNKPRIAYQKLICEATGLDREHVRIVAESRAAIFSSFMDSQKRIKADVGVVVFDFGSSTADFTYICTGELMLERSWKMGASEIEKIMLKLMLKQNGLTMDQIWQGNLYNLYLSLRLYKERYYSGKMGPVDAVVLMPYLVDGTGERILAGTSGTGESRYKTVTLLVEANDLDTFMDEVTGSVSIKVTENNEIKGYYTWESGCEAFMREMYALVKSKNQACKAVVLTGGASKMAFVQGTARRIFNGRDIKVYVEDIPSITVARGLCVVGKTDMEAGQFAQEHIGDIVDDAKKRLNDNVIVGGAAELAELAYQGAIVTLNGIQNAVTVKRLEELVKQGIEKKLDEETVRNIITRRMNYWQDDNVDTIKAHTGEVIEKLYSGLLPVDAIMLDRNQISEVINSANIDGRGVNVGEMKYGEFFRSVVANIAGAVAGGIAYVTAVIALSIILTGIPVLGPLIAVVFGGTIWEKVATFISENPNRTLKLKHIRKAAANLIKNKAEKCEEIQRQIEDKLRPSLDSDQLTSDLPAAFQKALDIGALKSFKVVDNCSDYKLPDAAGDF